MSDNFWKKIDYVTGLLPLGALFGLVAFVANVEIKDLDLWLHLGMGKFISLNGYVPDVDILSFSIVGHPWSNHEWLFQMIVYNIFNVWGAGGLLMMQVVVVVLTMLILLFIGYNKEKQLLITFILMLVYLVFQQRFTIRPDIFSLLFFTIYIYILALHIDKKWAPFSLMAVQILWSNMHGFFFFGPLFVLIGLVSEWIKRHIKLPYEWNVSGRLNDDEYKRLKATFVLVILACLVNPQFVEGAWYPIKVFFSLGGKNKVFFDFIQELQRPITMATIFDSNRFIYYKLLILISFVSFVLNRRRIDISALLFWMVFLVFSLKAARNTSYFAFAAYLVIVTNVLHIPYKDILPIRFSSKKFQYLTTAILNVLFLLWILNYCEGIAGRSYYDFNNYKPKSEFGGISQRNFPVRAVDFLVENNIKGNFFNDFNSGAYLIGRGFPNIRVFIDGRTELYGGDFFQEYREIWEKGNAEVFEEKASRFQITGAFLNSVRQKIPKETLKYFYEHEDWIPVYFDYDAVIFLKNIPAHQLIIEEYKVDLAHWKPKRFDYLKYGSTRAQAFEHNYRAYSLESLDLDEAALLEAEEAVKISPHYADPYHIMGKIYAKQEKYEQAFENLRIAALIAPNSKEIRYNLALSYYDMNEYEWAIREYKFMHERWPHDPRAVYHLSKTYAKDRQYEEAMKALRQAHDMDPEAIKDVLKIGDVIFEQDEFLKAKEAYALALKTNDQSAQAHKKMGILFKAMGDVSKAQEEFRRVLEIDPEDDEARQELNGLTL